MYGLGPMELIMILLVLAIPVAILAFFVVMMLVLVKSVNNIVRELESLNRNIKKG